MPLRFEFKGSQTVVQFPLGFCPGDRSNISDPQRNFKCRGDWGFVIKEWESVLKTYMWSYKHVNPITFQVRWANKQKTFIFYLLILGWCRYLRGRWNQSRYFRHEISDWNHHCETENEESRSNHDQRLIKEAIWHVLILIYFPDSDRPVVHVSERISELERREKYKIVYHYLNMTLNEGSLGVQLKTDNGGDSLVVIARHNNLPTLKECDLVKVVSDFSDVDGKWTYYVLLIHINTIFCLDDGFRLWSISNGVMNNRTGKWFLGVFAVDDAALLASLSSRRDCSAGPLLDKDQLSSDFKTGTYILQTYSTACYFFDEKSGIWEARGMSVSLARSLIEKQVFEL